jgi:hypothetical protein
LPSISTRAERVGQHLVPSRLTDEVRQCGDLHGVHRHRITALERAQQLGVAWPDHDGYPLAESSSSSAAEMEVPARRARR